MNHKSESIGERLKTRHKVGFISQPWRLIELYAGFITYRNRVKRFHRRYLPVFWTKSPMLHAKWREQITQHWTGSSEVTEPKVRLVTVDHPEQFELWNCLPKYDDLPKLSDLADDIAHIEKFLKKSDVPSPRKLPRPRWKKAL